MLIVSECNSKTGSALVFAATSFAPTILSPIQSLTFSCEAGDCSSKPFLEIFLESMRCCLQGFRDDQIDVERYLNLCYKGTDVPVMTPSPTDGDYAKVMALISNPNP